MPGAVRGERRFSDAARTVARRLVVRAVSAAAAAAITLLAPERAGAQVKPPTRPVAPARPRTAGDTLRVRAPVTRADSVARDSTARDSTRRELVRWSDPDSAMAALLARPGYTTTRYQGAEVRFDARDRGIALTGNGAAVQRGGTILVGDTVYYSDSLQLVRALGDTVILRDPGQGSDVVARGRIEYDLLRSRGTVSNISTDVQSGERWYVGGEQATFVNADSTVGRADKAFYVRDGTVTSCDLEKPDYYFKAKEIKLVSRNMLVARPAVLYIADVPVMVLPFIFQDLRSGRRSGILTPRFGVSELVRNSSTYRRHLENVGYYFALSDYLDAQTFLDWRSSAGATENDPGWTRYTGEVQYRWLNRFLTGRLATSYQALSSGERNVALSWAHQQDFSQNSHLTTNVNYVSNTRAQRRTQINPFAVLATVQSQANFQQQVGPFGIGIGGARTQYPGRDQVNQSFPTLSVSSRPVSIAPWLTWTPSLSASNVEELRIDRPDPFGFRYTPRSSGGVDSVAIVRNTRNSTLSLQSPFKIGDFVLQTSFTLSDRVNDLPTNLLVDVPVRGLDGAPIRVNGRDSVVRENRLFARDYRTGADFGVSFGLPQLLQGSWNVAPSVSIVNVAGGDYFVRSQFTNGTWVNQSKRLQYGISSSPTFFGLFRGFGPVSRFRHAITPSVSYGYAPAARVSDAYLAATNSSRAGSLSSIAQNTVSLRFATNLEAKLSSGADTASEGGGTKLKVLGLDFTGLTYDFARLGELRRRSDERTLSGGTPAGGVGALAGFSTPNFGFSARSDLLPGFDVNVDYSLFAGDVASDTARFDPYRQSVSASFSLDQTSSIFAVLSRVFGRAVPTIAPQVEQITPTAQDALARQTAASPVAGSGSRNAQFAIPTGKGWRASFNFSSARQRPTVGAVVLDAAAVCGSLARNPFVFAQCQANPARFQQQIGGGTNVPINSGGTIYQQAPTTTLGSQMTFDITPKWAAAWGTSYDFRRKDFADQTVTLQRELHDWRAVFGYTKASNGAFAFRFFISLNAQPELKFDYDQRTFRR